MYKNFLEFFHSCEALDHDIQQQLQVLVQTSLLGLRGVCPFIPGLTDLREALLGLGCSLSLVFVAGLGTSFLLLLQNPSFLVEFMGFYLNCSCVKALPCSLFIRFIYIYCLAPQQNADLVPLDFTWSGPLVGTPQKRSVLQTPVFSEVIQPGLRVSVTFPNHWEPLENEANQINRITIPEVEFIKFLGVYWSNPTIRHTLVFTAGSHETCLDLLGYGEPHSNPQCSSASWYQNLFFFFFFQLLLSFLHTSKQSCFSKKLTVFWSTYIYV